MDEEGAPYKTSCVPSCDEGYRLMSGSPKVCLSDGTWLDNSTVTCVAIGKKSVAETPD